MHNHVIAVRNKTIGAAYRHVFKPLAFRRDPEEVHDRMTAVGEMLGRTAAGRGATRAAFGYRNPMLEQTLLGIRFPNPIGLSAGFDKNARLVDILPAVGFGFAELGSITGEASPGNPKPRLWRMPESKSLLVYYGLMNDGAEAISKRLAGRKFAIPMGVSVAKTNSRDTVDVQAGVDDYVKAYRAFTDIGAYYTLNISCPNAYGGEPFTEPGRLEKLLTAIDKEPHTKPVFVKFSPDLAAEDLDKVLGVAMGHNVQGFVCSNLTKKRDNPKIKDKGLPEVGGISGKVQEDLGEAQLRRVRARAGGKYLLVGCGGVFTAEDAYRKIRAGASLLELITGMIYQGPQSISEINRGLVKLLKRDGFKNISEAVGAGVR